MEASIAPSSFDKDVELLPSSFHKFEFSDKIMDLNVFCQVIEMKESYYIWVGTVPSKLGNLSLSLKTPFVFSTPYSLHSGCSTLIIYNIWGCV
jgi:hypothetical protein